MPLHKWGIHSTLNSSQWFIFTPNTPPHSSGFIYSSWSLQIKCMCTRCFTKDCLKEIFHGVSSKRAGTFKSSEKVYSQSPLTPSLDPAELTHSKLLHLPIPDCSGTWMPWGRKQSSQNHSWPPTHMPQSSCPRTSEVWHGTEWKAEALSCGTPGHLVSPMVTQSSAASKFLILLLEKTQRPLPLFCHSLIVRERTLCSLVLFMENR